MKETIISIIALGLFIYSLRISISFSPFKISCEQPFLSLSFIFILFGVILMGLHYEKNGYSKGYINGVNDAKKIIIEELNKKQNENN